MSQGTNSKQFDNGREVIRKIKIGDLTVSKDGKINGYIPKIRREEINFDKLFSEADDIRGLAEIQFETIDDS